MAAEEAKVEWLQSLVARAPLVMPLTPPQRWTPPRLSSSDGFAAAMDPDALAAGSEAFDSGARAEPRLR